MKLFVRNDGVLGRTVGVALLVFGLSFSSFAGDESSIDSTSTKKNEKKMQAKAKKRRASTGSKRRQGLRRPGESTQTRSTQTDQALLQHLFDPNLDEQTVRARLSEIAPTRAVEVLGVVTDDYLLRKDQIEEKASQGEKKTIIVGADLEGALLVSSLVQRDPAHARDILVLAPFSEREQTKRSINQSLTEAGQLEAFSEETAKALSPLLFSLENIYSFGRALDPSMARLAAIISIRAQNVDILFSKSVNEVRFSETLQYDLCTQDGSHYEANQVFFTLGSHTERPQEWASTYIHEGRSEEISQALHGRIAVPQVDTAISFFRRLSLNPATKFLRLYNNRRIGVFGDPVLSANVISTLTTHFSKSKTRPQSIAWWGAPESQQGEEVVANLNETWSKAQSAHHIQFYRSSGLISAIDRNIVETIHAPLSRVHSDPFRGSFEVFWDTTPKKLKKKIRKLPEVEQAIVSQESSRELDYLILALPTEPSSKTIVEHSRKLHQFFPNAKFSAVFFKPESHFSSLKSPNPKRDAIASQLYLSPNKPSRIYFVGQDSGLEVDPKLLTKSQVANSHSIEFQAPRIQNFAKWARAQVLDNEPEDPFINKSPETTGYWESSTGHQFKRIKITGFLVNSKIGWQDPSGKVWLTQAKIDQVYRRVGHYRTNYASAKTACTTSGGVMPTAKDFARLRSYLGNDDLRGTGLHTPPDFLKYYGQENLWTKTSPRFKLRNIYQTGHTKMITSPYSPEYFEQHRYTHTGFLCILN